MKTIFTFIFTTIIITLSAQESIMSELKKVFYSLPIDSNVENIIEAAKQVEQLAEIDYESEPFEPYFQGTFTTNNYFQIKPISGNMEIFISNYGLAGQYVDSLQVIYLSLYFGNKLTKEILNEYKRLITIFENLTTKITQHEYYADSGKIGYGKNFYLNKEDELPIIAIKIGLGSCTSDIKSITISYYKKLSLTKTIRNSVKGSN